MMLEAFSRCQLLLVEGDWGREGSGFFSPLVNNWALLLGWTINVKSHCQGGGYRRCWQGGKPGWNTGRMSWGASGKELTLTEGIQGLQFRQELERNIGKILVADSCCGLGIGSSLMFIESSN